MKHDINVEIKKIYIPKKDGTKRVLHVPQNPKHIEWLNSKEKILSGLSMPYYVCAFAPGRNIYNYVKPHLLRIKTNKVISCDIYKCFDNIRTQTIIDGINYYISNTKVTEQEKNCLEEIIENINLVAPNGFLPQGFCTSPVLSNIALCRMDDEIISALKNDLGLDDLVYTRYADNLMVSSMQLGLKNHRSIIVSIIDNIYRKYGLRLHRDKINLYVKYTSKDYTKICGISIFIKDGITRMTRKLRHRLRGVKHRLLVKKDNSKKVRDLFNGLYGFGQMVSTDWPDEYKNLLKVEDTTRRSKKVKKHKKKSRKETNNGKKA